MNRTALSALVAAGVATTVIVAGAQAQSSRVGAVPVNTFIVNEVGFGKQPYVALKNFTKASSALSRLYLCQGTKCYRLPNVTVRPGRTVRIATGSGAGRTKVVARHATIGALRPANGEVALFASKSLRDPKAMLTYFQWGSPKHVLTPVALKAGLWRKGAYAPSSPDAVLLRRTAGGLWVYK